MSKITLKVKDIPGIGLEAECISPDVFAGKSLEDINKLKAYVGNKIETIGNFFDISIDTSGSPSASDASSDVTKNPNEIKIVIDGDVSKVKRIGQEMSAGEILINGDTGMHLGSKMSGGKIVACGNSGSWAGMEMSGGELEIKGNSGNFVGSAYRGSVDGMTGGKISIHGNVRTNTGACMKGGSIIIKGNSGEFTGIRMSGGIIWVGGVADCRIGAEMTGGSIIIAGKAIEILPSFRKEKITDEIDLDKISFDNSGDKKNESGNGIGEIRGKLKGKFTRYIGDLAEGGKGEIYVIEV